MSPSIGCDSMLGSAGWLDLCSAVVRCVWFYGALNGLAVEASVEHARVLARANSVRQSPARQLCFSTIKFPRTSVSISLFEKVLKALAGVFTIGSPFRLKEVLSTAGTPVACPNRSIN